MNANEVTQRFVQSYYNFNLMQKGLRPCTLEMVCKLITAYNINPRWLFSGVGGFFVEYT